MEQTFPLDPVNGIDVSPHIKQRGVGVVDLTGFQVTLDNFACLVGELGHIQLGEPVSGTLGRRLLEDEPQSAFLAHLPAEEIHVGDDLQAEFHCLD